MNWARFDTMAWPLPDVALSEIEWRLRHGTPSTADIMAAAEVIAAYRQMVFDPEKKRRVVIRHLREKNPVPVGFVRKSVGVLPTALKRREWCYVLPPKAFEMSPCACGNVDTRWSEYERHLWCDRCKIDFEPEDTGLFGGPVLPHVAACMGVRFDRLILATGQVERFNLATSGWDPAESPA